MFTPFAKALGIPAALAFVAMATLTSWGDACYETFAKERKPMAVSQFKLAVPPLDAVQPAKFETATFALG